MHSLRQSCARLFMFAKGIYLRVTRASVVKGSTSAAALLPRGEGWRSKRGEAAQRDAAAAGVHSGAGRGRAMASAPCWLGPAHIIYSLCKRAAAGHAYLEVCLIAHSRLQRSCRSHSAAARPPALLCFDTASTPCRVATKATIAWSKSPGGRQGMYSARSWTMLQKQTLMLAISPSPELKEHTGNHLGAARACARPWVRAAAKRRGCWARSCPGCWVRWHVARFHR